jgi:hypothetical protein
MKLPRRLPAPIKQAFSKIWEALNSELSTVVVSKMHFKGEDGTILADWHLLTINAMEAPPVVASKLAELEALIHEHTFSEEVAKAQSNPP